MAPAPHDRTRSLGPALFGLIALVGMGWFLSSRPGPSPSPAPQDAGERAAPSLADAAPTVVADVAVAAEDVRPVVACVPACEDGSFCRDGVCHAFAEVQCEGQAACDGPGGRACFDAVSPCDTGYAMTPCQSPGRRECRDGGVVCIPTGRTAGGCSPPNGGVCDPQAQCRCPADRPSSCADWWAQPGTRVCTDMTTDDSHCGGCDRVCDASGSARAVCREGRCVCPQGTVACDEMGERALYVRCRARCADAPATTADASTRDVSTDAITDVSTDASARDASTDAITGTSAADAPPVDGGGAGDAAPTAGDAASG